MYSAGHNRGRIAFATCANDRELTAHRHLGATAARNFIQIHYFGFIHPNGGRFARRPLRLEAMARIPDAYLWIAGEGPTAVFIRMGFGAISILAIFSGISGFIVGGMYVVIYNVLTGMTSGLELELGVNSLFGSGL